MGRLKKMAGSMNQQNYELLCEIIAEDLQNDGQQNMLNDLARDTVYSINNREFLSDFEKITRDYYKEIGKELSPEAIAADISKHFS